MNTVTIISITFDNIYTLTYFFLVIFGINTMDHPYCYLFELILIIVLYQRAKKIYGAFRLTFFALTYEYQFKSMDLVLNLLIFIHIIVHQSLYRQSYSLVPPNLTTVKIGSNPLVQLSTSSSADTSIRFTFAPPQSSQSGMVM